MSNLYLIDTCVWRDFYENRTSKTGKQLGKEAYKLFNKILKSRSKIIYSETLLQELEKDYSKKEIKNLLGVLFLAGKIIRICITKEQHIEAKEMCIKRNIPYVDCLNAIHARDYKAVLITQDIHFFNNLSDITKPSKPEDVI